MKFLHGLWDDDLRFGLPVHPLCSRDIFVGIGIPLLNLAQSLIDGVEEVLFEAFRADMKIVWRNVGWDVVVVKPLVGMMGRSGIGERIVRIRSVVCFCSE